MKLAQPKARFSPASDRVSAFLRDLLAGRLEEAADLVSDDLVFLGRTGWRGVGTPFREDARFVEGSLRQLPPEEVAAIPAAKQREAFEVEIGPEELVFFAIIKTPGARATLGILARPAPAGDGYEICRIFDTKRVKPVLLSD